MQEDKSYRAIQTSITRKYSVASVVHDYLFLSHFYPLLTNVFNIPLIYSEHEPGIPLTLGNHETICETLTTPSLDTILPLTPTEIFQPPFSFPPLTCGKYMKLGKPTSFAFVLANIW
jgi:hypothetical protein